MQKISHFTSHTLFHPTSGYYRARNPLDDFITAPEISQVFGELIAAYILQISSTKKSKISLVEMGAGKGTLFFDILSTIKKLAEKKNPQAIDFLERATFHIIEINEVLKKIQQEKLKDFAVSWYENFDGFLSEDSSKTGFVTPSSCSDQAQVDVNGWTGLQTPSSARASRHKSNAELFFISNELFDCFPIDQFVKTDIGWCERLIDSGKFITANFDPEIHQFVESEVKENVPFGVVFEHSSAAKNFMSQLCEALKTHGGIAINFDYGYAKTEFANTLQAVKNHQKVSIFEKDCDITAHVDFSALEKIAKNFGLNSSLITQREFLISLGIEERRKILPPSENSAIDRLIAPDQMGELFKCHIVWREPNEVASRQS
jgi:NADH dehydrogenase [ubiquinone] 1 alpha subcomplex assembly factor 7